MIIRAYNETYGMNTVITNCSNNYGPKQHDEKLIPTIIRNALKGNPIPILNDVIANSIHSEYYDNSSMIDKMFSPAALSIPQNFIEGTTGAMEAIATGDEEALQKGEFKTVKSITDLSPTKSFWLTKALHQEYVTDFLQAIIDPEGYERKRRKKEKELEDQGKENVFNLFD